MSKWILELLGGVKLLNPGPVDSVRYNEKNIPYIDTSEVLAQNPKQSRSVGQVYYVQGASGVEEYWFKEGTDDVHLIKKETSLGTTKWGSITGALSDQTDLKTALDFKSDEGHSHLSSDLIDFDSAVSNSTDVVHNTAARHSHTNIALLDSLKNNGQGDNFLADDGAYKAIPQQSNTWLSDTLNTSTPSTAGWLINTNMAANTELSIDFTIHTNSEPPIFGTVYARQAASTPPFIGAIFITNVGIVSADCTAYENTSNNTISIWIRHKSNPASAELYALAKSPSGDNVEITSVTAYDQPPPTLGNSQAAIVEYPERWLKNPQNDGDILSSTQTGIRSWITPAQVLTSAKSSNASIIGVVDNINIGTTFGTLSFTTTSINNVAIQNGTDIVFSKPCKVAIVLTLNIINLDASQNTVHLKPMFWNGSIWAQDVDAKIFTVAGSVNDSRTATFINEVSAGDKIKFELVCETGTLGITLKHTTTTVGADQFVIYGGTIRLIEV